MLFKKTLNPGLLGVSTKVDNEIPTSHPDATMVSFVKPNYFALRKRADAYHGRVLAHMHALYRESGLPAAGFPHSAEAAALSMSYGEPWPGIDYNKVRQFLYLQRQRLYAAHRRLARLVILGKTDLGCTQPTLSDNPVSATANDREF